MMAYKLIQRAKDDRPIYVRSLAARLASVSQEFLIRCEQQGLVKARLMTGGGTGFTVKAIRQLTIIRRLHQDLDLDLETIEIVLHMRNQILDLQAQLEKEQRRAQQREKRILKELQELRKALAEQGRG